MWYLTMHSTHFIYGYTALDKPVEGYSNINQSKEYNVLFNDALNTFYLRLYDVG